MDQKLVQFFLLGTLIITAHAWNMTSTRVYDIQEGSDFSPHITYKKDNDDPGIQFDVTEEQCKAAGNLVGRATTKLTVATPRMHAVKYQPTSQEYIIQSLADCGGGVYVKVTGCDIDGCNQFHVYYK